MIEFRYLVRIKIDTINQYIIILRILYLTCTLITALWWHLFTLYIEVSDKRTCMINIQPLLSVLFSSTPFIITLSSLFLTFIIHYWCCWLSHNVKFMLFFCNVWRFGLNNVVYLLCLSLKSKSSKHVPHLYAKIELRSTSAPSPMSGINHFVNWIMWNSCCCFAMFDVLV